MKFRNSAKDRLTLQVTSADIWKSFREINGCGIAVYKIVQEDALTYSFQINRADLVPLQTLLERRGDSIKVQAHSRIYFVQQSILRRPLFYGGLLVFFLISLLLPTRILGIQVEGNETVPTRRILEAAQEAGVELFASCANVRSEQVKNALLSAIPELQWAGVNTFGCRAVISVQERTPQETETEERENVSSIVAERDGIVESITALQGTAACQVGQAVKKGQVLISGYTDCGIFIRAQRAKGEVYAKTLRTVRAITPSTQAVRSGNSKTFRSFALVLGKKRINLWKDSRISDSSCGRISVVYSLTLPGGFSLPVSLACDTFTQCEPEQTAVDESETEEELLLYTQKYLLSQMIAGTVSYSDDVLETSSGALLLTRQFLCTEMIGREHFEIGEPQ